MSSHTIRKEGTKKLRVFHLQNQPLIRHYSYSQVVSICQIGGRISQDLDLLFILRLIIEKGNNSSIEAHIFQIPIDSLFCVKFRVLAYNATFEIIFDDLIIYVVEEAEHLFVSVQCD